MKVKIKFIICGVLIAIFNLVAYLTAHIDTPFIIRYIMLFSYYSIQILFLFYAIKLKNRSIYFFPVYWGIEIWRLLFNNIIRFGYTYKNNPFLEFMYLRVTQFLWMGDYLHVRGCSVICYVHQFPIDVFEDDIIKFAVSLVAFAISLRYSVTRFKKLR